MFITRGMSTFEAPIVNRLGQVFHIYIIIVTIYIIMQNIQIIPIFTNFLPNLAMEMSILFSSHDFHSKLSQCLMSHVLPSYFIFVDLSHILSQTL